MAIGAPVRNASIAFAGMTASALAVVTDQRMDGRPVVGYAFDSIGRYGHGSLLRERFIPRLLGAEPDALRDGSGLIDPPAAARVLMQNEKAGGHGERPGAVALLEAALWDAAAKASGEPLWRVLSKRFGGAAGAAPGPDIAVYATCGHLRIGAHGHGDELAALGDATARATAHGYTTVKIKVTGEPAADLARIDAAARAIAPANLAVDVNGALTDVTGPAWMERIGARSLAWIEEPCDPLDFALLSTLAAGSPIAIATGENLFSFADARNLLRYGGLRPQRDTIQVDPLLSYGLDEYLRIVRLFESHGWHRSRFYPHAGHLFAAHVVAGLGLGSAEAAPDADLPYGGFWDGSVVEHGRLHIRDLPGVGFEGKRNLYGILRGLGR